MSADGLVQLWAMTSPTGILKAAPKVLVNSARFDIAVLSRITDGALVLEAAVVGGDPARSVELTDRLADPVRLHPPLPEVEIVRRPQTALLRMDPLKGSPFSQALGSATYVVAAITLGTRVTGLLHAACASQSPANASDRDVLEAFAFGTSQAFERATLRREIQHERDQLRQFLAWLDARSGQLANTNMSLDAPDAIATERQPGYPQPGDGGTHRRPLDDLLTRREVEVLELLCEGMSNQGIADELVISTGTVKFHVNKILAKLHVSNRAEAVARYHSLLASKVR